MCEWRSIRDWPWTDRARTLALGAVLIGVLLAIGVAGGIQ